MVDDRHPESRAKPDRASFRKLARPGRVVPVYLEFPFDTETAVTAYDKLRRGPFGFLLESVIGGERWARYTFLGTEPREAWRLTEDRIERWRPDGGWDEGRVTEDPLEDFRRWVGRQEPVELDGLPRFWGGAVGFFGYDAVRWLEHLPDPPPRDIACPDACFLLTDRMLIIDNLFGRAFALKAVVVPEPREGASAAGGTGDPTDADALHESAVRELREWLERLRTPSELEPLPAAGALDDPGRVAFTSNRSRDDFEAAVERIRDYIVEGDAYQVVLSQRLEAETGASPLAIYRALRTLNPSPYLYLLELDGVRLVGSSPELLARVEDGRVTVRPIAGTRRRGADDREDRALAEDLLGDEKERSEHLMLVDLGRNDVGRVARPGSVRVPVFMEIEKYSDVIHMVSEVTGELREDATALEALRSCFPAGTLTGAPKVRAMEIIDELEPTRRAVYGGAAGYVAYGGRTLDMAITIRTLLHLGSRAWVQAGAGIVHDSVPSREWEETLDKARALLHALHLAQGSARDGSRGE